MLRYTKWLELLHLFHKVQMYYQVKIDFLKKWKMYCNSLSYLGLVI